MVDVHLGARQGSQQRALARIRIADDGQDRDRAAPPAAAAGSGVARRASSTRVRAGSGDPGYAGGRPRASSRRVPPSADAAGESRQRDLGALREPREQVLELRQLHSAACRRRVVACCAKMSRMSCVRSITRSSMRSPRLRACVGVRSWSTITRSTSLWQLADLRVQVADRRLVLRRAGRSAAGEHLVQPLDRLPLPGAHLVRMDLVLGRDRLHRSVPPQRLERHPFLEVRREPAAPFRRHPSASPSPGIHLGRLSERPRPPQSRQQSGSGRRGRGPRGLVHQSFRERIHLAGSRC